MGSFSAHLQFIVVCFWEIGKKLLDKCFCVIKWKETIR